MRTVAGGGHLVAVALILAAPLGCKVDFPRGDTQFLCSDGESCPSGTVCQQGMCMPDVTPDDDAGPDTVDASVPECMATPHLVVSEVNVTPEVLEYIEIANPTDTAVDLTHYYLSDDPKYVFTPDIANATPPTNSDFIVKFPDAASVDPGGVLVIALDPASYETQFGEAPDLGFDEDMVRVAPAVGSASLNNGGESMVLFYWDGATDVVSDVDIVIWGSEGDTVLGAKSGVSVDGPDADTEATAYPADADTFTPIDPGAPADSMQRIQGEGDREAEGGNGLDLGGIRHDETTEPLDATWAVQAPSPGAMAFCLP